MRNRSLFLICVIGLFLSCCYSTNHIFLTGCKYDPKTQKSEFSYLGDYSYYIYIPGNWKYSRFDNPSQDNIFIDSLNHKVRISVGIKCKSEFNPNNDLCDSSFINSYYKWDVDWITKNHDGFTVTVLDHNPDKYIIGKLITKDWTNYHLYGINKKYVIRITIGDLLLADEEKSKDLLLQIFNSIK